MTDRNAGDLSLMRRVVLGDGAALGDLMDAYWRKLVGYAAHLLGDVDTAHDVAQQAFAKLREPWRHALATPRPPASG